MTTITNHFNNDANIKTKFNWQKNLAINIQTHTQIYTHIQIVLYKEK
jgi:hypothetical protein